MAEEQLLNPDERRAAVVDRKVSIGNGKFVMAQKLDMPTLVLEGVVPMPLLAAMQRMLKNERAVTDIERLTSMTDEERQDFLALLRRFAVAAVTQPRLSESDQREPGVLPVTMLDFDELMKIWQECASIGAMGAAAADRFREAGRTDDVPAAPARTDVPPAAELVGAGAEVRSA